MQPYKCISCHRHFSQFDSFKRHHVRHKTRYASQKSVVNASHTTTNVQRKYELTKVSDASQYECPYCKLPLQNRCDLLKHLRLHTADATPVKIHPASASPELSNLNNQSNPDRDELENKSVKKKRKRKKERKKKETYNCSVCHIVCKSKRALKHHGTLHVIHQCDICPRILKSKAGLITHRRIHSIVGQGVAKSVSTGTGGEGGVEKVLNGECMYVRVVRKLDSAPKRRLYETDTQADDDVIICQTAGDQIEVPSKDQFLDNLVLYACTICKFVAETKATWLAHQKSHRPAEPEKCPQCKDVFTSKSDLQNHLRLHSGLQPFTCSFCKQQFVDFLVLSKHEAQHLARCSEPLNSELKCEICALHFKCPSGLSKHAKTDHPGLKPFKCQKCDKDYLFLNDLVRHNRTHTGERPFVCSHCPKSFTHKKYLNIHERSHTGYAPYSCKFCSKTFKLKDSLTYHERTHTGEKPHTCQICGKGYITGSGLKYHERSTHVTEKPFKCSICANSFAQKSDLMVHVRTHTGVKPFKCAKCGKAFVSKNHLSRHEKTHDKDRKRQNVCKQCGKAYLDKRSLHNHISVHHP